MERTYLEKTLVDAAQNVDVLEPHWYTSQEYASFLEQAGFLAQYYRESREDQIAAAVVDEFVIFLRLLRKALLDPDVTPDESERVQSELDYLELVLERIVTASVND